MVFVKIKTRLTDRHIFFPFLFFGLLCVSRMWSQPFGSHKIAVTPKVKPASAINEESYRSLLRGKYSGKFKTEDELNRFVNYSLVIKKQFFESNYIYTNLPEISAYVKDILYKVIPERLLDTSLKVYIVRDPDFNASVLGDGSVFVNIGLLANIKNEAELAAILGHEFGHFDAEHSLKSYNEMVKSKANADATGSSGYYGLLASLYGMHRLSKKFVANELESDNYAIKLMREKGFSPEALRNNFRMFQKGEKKYKAQLGYKTSWFYFKTHPSNDNRIKNIENQFAPDELKEGLQFFYNAKTFLEVKNRAIDECINLNFEFKDYEDCIELAYKQHLFFPGDEFYLFFLIECIKRQANLNPIFQERLFITGRYDPASLRDTVLRTNRINIETSNTNPWLRHESSIFFHMKDFIYNMNDEEFNQIRNDKLKNTDTLEFLTNTDALKYFSKKIAHVSSIYNLVHQDSLGKEVLKSETWSEIEEKFHELSRLRETVPGAVMNYTNSFAAIYSVDSRSQLGPYGGLNFDIEHSLYVGYLDYVKRIKSSIKWFDNVGFRDKYDLSNSCALFVNILPFSENQREVNETKFDMFKIDPELLRISATYQIRKLFFSNIMLRTDVKVAFASDDEVYTRCCFVTYCLDFAKNTIRYKTNCLYLKAGSTFDEVYKEIINSYFDLAN